MLLVGEVQYQRLDRLFELSRALQSRAQRIQVAIADWSSRPPEVLRLSPTMQGRCLSEA
jgi:hypothetical protein